MDLPILTNPTTDKPWLNIYANSLTAKTITAQTSLVVPSLVVNGDAEVKGDLLVDGNLQSDNLTIGSLFFSTATQTVAIPAGTGASGFTNFNPVLKKVVAGGLAGANTGLSTIDGGTWLQLTTPFVNAGFGYSPDLNIYVGIDGSGTAIYTWPTAVNGTWVLRPAAPSAFEFNSMEWIPAFQRFYTGSITAGQRIFSSTDGVTWATQSATRESRYFAYSPLLNRLVTVGSNGPQYTDDGKIWIASPSVASMANVTWSPFWKCFVGIPRGGPLTAVYRSVDGITWTTSTGFPGFAGNLRGIVWIQEFMTFVVCGDNDVQFVSQDGFVWRQSQLVTAGFSPQVNTYVPQWAMYLAVGTNPFARVSPKVFL